MQEASCEYKQYLQSGVLELDDKISLTNSAQQNEGNLHRIHYRYGQAIHAYSEVVREIPSDASIYSLRGVAFGFRGDFPNALKDFRIALSQEFSYPLAYVQYVLILKNYLQSLVTIIVDDEKNHDSVVSKIDYNEIEKIFSFVLEKISGAYSPLSKDSLIIKSIKNLLIEIINLYLPFKIKLIDHLKNRLKISLSIGHTFTSKLYH